MKETNHLLPIGTVVTISSLGTKPLVVVSHKARAGLGPEHDYVGYLWPEGWMGNDSSHVKYFDGPDVQEVLHMGYVDENWLRLRELLEDSGSGPISRDQWWKGSGPADV